MTDWIRARTEEQKASRLQEIYTVARQHLHTHPFSLISLASIAKDLSFSRANLYKYFQSKEDIYLSLLGEEAEIFAGQLSHRLKDNEIKGVHSFLEVWIETFVNAETLRTLLSMTATILEQNCTDDVLVHTKGRIANGLSEDLIPAMQATLPNHSTAECLELQETLLMMGNGVLSFCGLNSHQQQVLQEHGLGALVREDFETEYRRVVARLYPAV